MNHSGTHLFVELYDLVSNGPSVRRPVLLLPVHERNKRFLFSKNEFGLNICVVLNPVCIATTTSYSSTNGVSDLNLRRNETKHPTNTDPKLSA